MQVRACSERFLSDLESAWQESVILNQITDIIRYHAKSHFQVKYNPTPFELKNDPTPFKLKNVILMHILTYNPPTHMGPAKGEVDGNSHKIYIPDSLYFSFNLTLHCNIFLCMTSTLFYRAQSLLNNTRIFLDSKDYKACY